MKSHMFDENFVCQNCKLEAPENQICMNFENMSFEDTLVDKIDVEDDIDNVSKNVDVVKSLHETQDLVIQLDNIKIVLKNKNNVKINISPDQKEFQILML